MKKIFTLIAAAFVAVSVSAQGTYAVQNGDPGVAAGTQVTTVSNMTFTWGVAGGADFKGGNKKNAALKAQLGSTAYCEGNGENGKFDAKTECYSGTVYFFEPKSNGTVTVGWVLNGNKAFYIQECSGATRVDVSFTTVNSEGTTVELANGGKLADKLTGGLSTFAVEAGKKYAVYCASKLGFYGFKYELGTPAGISSVESDASAASSAIYNSVGQRVNANAKGLVIKNGKKFVNR